jgi:hypothetical protein
MANRFPLVVDTDDGNKLKEIPIGDQLDLANSGIANLTELSVAGALSGATLSTTGNVSVGGNIVVTGTTTLGVATISTVNATNINLGGETVRVPVQSDWNEEDNTSLAFIQNKPDIGNVINSINDIGDVDTVGAVNGDILVYNGFEWQSEANDGGTPESIQDAVYVPGIGPNPIGVRTLTPSGRGSMDFQNVKADPFYGNFLYTPPNALIKGQQDNISELLNDSLYVDQAFLNAVDSVTGKYLKGNDVVGFGRITATVNSSTGRAELTFDESGLLTQEVDTLETVTGRGATTSLAIEADAFNQAAASTSTSTIKFINAETIDILTSLTATNANFTTTNGTISATNGQVIANQASFANQVDGGNMRLSVNSLSNTAGNNVEINGGSGKVDIQGNGLNMPSSATLPGSPAEGDVYFSNNALYMYVGDDGAGAADWVLIGGPGNGSGSYGMQLPAFENTDFPSLTNEGALIYDLTDSLVRVWNGTSWAAL